MRGSTGAGDRGREGGGLRASIILPAYENPEAVARALAALGKQEPAGGALEVIEVIVVDDGSEPPLQGRAIAGPGAAGARWLRLPRNTGRGAARNEGARGARGEILLFCDSDLSPRPGWAAAHLAAHGRAGGLVGVVGRTLWEGQRVLDRYLETRGAAKLAEGTPIPWRYLTAANLSIPAETFRSLGGFDETLGGWGGEDTLLGYRLALAGVRIVQAPKAVALHPPAPPLAHLLARHREFGARVLRPLAHRSAELAAMFRADLLAPVDLRGDGPGRALAKVAARLLCRLPGRGAMGRLAEGFLPGRLAFPVLDYLLFRAVAEGYTREPGE